MIRIQRSYSPFNIPPLSPHNHVFTAFNRLLIGQATFNALERIGGRIMELEAMSMSETRLTRSNNDRVIAGVCGGLAAYLDIDSVLVRLAFVILLFASGIGLPIYVILWIVMPEQDSDSSSDAEVIQKNLGEMGETVYSGVSRMGRPGTVGVVLVLLGAYFLFNQLGWLNWISGAIFWPLVIIGFGIYLLIKRNK
jgi:phage shock protein PspC (stress-responsive transcriptional regulator)